MKNYYSTLDGIITTFSNIEPDRDGFEHISIRFERDIIHFAEFRLPENQIFKSFGFSDDEIMQLSEYLRDNAPLIWEIAREEGDSLA
ncbi:MAG: hypothetical protein LUG99_20105 [Lachnospiraceae bacterium]|nr:hypothetical protein [Lachnospiraceae bacterium]